MQPTLTTATRICSQPPGSWLVERSLVQPGMKLRNRHRYCMVRHTSEPTSLGGSQLPRHFLPSVGVGSEGVGVTLNSSTPWRKTRSKSPTSARTSGGWLQGLPL